MFVNAFETPHRSPCMDSWKLVSDANPVSTPTPAIANDPEIVAAAMLQRTELGHLEVPGPQRKTLFNAPAPGPR